MREVLLFAIDGHQYGVWKDHVISMEEVGAVHRLPFLRSSLTVLAVIGERTRTLADLAPCLGHEPVREKRSARALVMSEQGQVRGFVVGAYVSSLEAAPGSAIPLPEYLHIPFVEGFLPHDGQLVPLIDIRDLFRQVSREGRPPRISAHALRGMPARPQGPERSGWLPQGGAFLPSRHGKCCGSRSTGS